MIRKEKGRWRAAHGKQSTKTSRHSSVKIDTTYTEKEKHGNKDTEHEETGNRPNERGGERIPKNKSADM